MWVLLFASIVSLEGCIIEGNRVRADNFATSPIGSFTYTAQTNTVMTTSSPQGAAFSAS
jgi:hypothetical protein